MAGHSKWSNIKRKKEKTDAQRAKIFTKIGRDIAVAVAEGGADPSSNSHLRDLIAKAKSLNVPNDNINRIIKKAEGGEKDDYEGIVYEGYGPSGVAVMVETLTDNRNRTAASMRHYFDKYGGNMGQAGSVSFMFNKQGIVVAQNIKDEELLMEQVFEAGADDFYLDADVCEIYSQPEKVSEVANFLRENGYDVVSAEAEQVPTNYVVLSEPEAIKNMAQLLEHLEEDDDVQQVWHNIENENLLYE